MQETTKEIARREKQGKARREDEPVEKVTSP